MFRVVEGEQDRPWRDQWMVDDDFVVLGEVRARLGIFFFGCHATVAVSEPGHLKCSRPFYRTQRRRQKFSLRNLFAAANLGRKSFLSLFQRALAGQQFWCLFMKHCERK